MKLISKNFTRAVMVATALTASAFIAPIESSHAMGNLTKEQLVDVFNEFSPCLAFGHLDRDGYKFSDPAEHQYDEVLRKYATALESYSKWDETIKRLTDLGYLATGVCVNSSDKKDGKIIIEQILGSIDINIIKDTSWGRSIKSPKEVNDEIDLSVYLTIRTINIKGLAYGLVGPELTPETAAFINTVVTANAEAEAILSTMERGIKEGRLNDLAGVLYGNNPIFSDIISELYITVVNAGHITDENRSAFKASILTKLMHDNDFRSQQFKNTGRMMATLGEQGIDINEFFNIAPDEKRIDEALDQRFGKELATIKINGKSLQDSYRNFWANNPNDPATAIKEKIDELKNMLKQKKGVTPTPAPAALYH